MGDLGCNVNMSAGLKCHEDSGGVRGRGDRAAGSGGGDLNNTHPQQRDYEIIEMSHCLPLSPSELFYKLASLASAI